jgi:O-antigen ligase
MGKRGAIAFAIFIVLASVLAALALVSVKLALVAGVGLAAVAIIFMKPFYGLLIYIVMLFVRPQDFVPSLERLRVMLLLAAVILLTFFIHKVIRREPISFFATRQHILLFILLVLVPVSEIANGLVAEAWDSLNEFLAVFLLFFLIVSITDDFDRFRKVCWLLVFCTTLISINGIVMHFRGVGLAGTTPVEGTRVRWIGIFGDPNDLALTINSFFPFILMSLFDPGVGRLKKLLLVAAAAVAVLTLFWTNSRGGFIAFVAIIGVFAIKRWGVLKGIAVGAVFMAAALLFAPSRMGNISPYEVSAAGRVNSWIDGLVMLKSNPVFGVGFLNFEKHATLSAHSAFIQSMAELGVVGYFVWMALVSMCFFDIHAVSRTLDYPYAKYARILQLSFIGFLVSAVFLSQAYMPVLYILAALITHVVNSPVAGRSFPRFLSPWEFAKVFVLMAGSILMYKVLAMVYI